MLSAGVRESFGKGVRTILDAGASLVTGGQPGGGKGVCFQNTLMRVSGRQFLANPHVFQTEAFGNGNSIAIVVETNTGCVLGSGRIGSRGKSGSDLGREAAEELVEAVKIRACVDHHLQDQLIIFMALASGVSRIRTGPLTLHTKTAIHVAEQLTEAKFSVEPCPDEAGVHFIECRGISFVNNS